ncbi:MarR family transcriptional regulator [Nonomuraea turkmeniaca]|uniref:MarR family transcriptional regulator n=1 Tax=Nonomuraea turkmeniaca TaxID=103838 RepID=UPI001FEA9901|nr:helix-turn-helix domain-containing protein [Nonomuraea turkmeniaca]
MLIEIARDPEVRIRDIAAKVGITECAVQAIITDLHQAGCLARERSGRRNRYSLHLDQPFRHWTEAGCRSACWSPSSLTTTCTARPTHRRERHGRPGTLCDSRVQNAISGEAQVRDVEDEPLFIEPAAGLDIGRRKSRPPSGFRAGTGPAAACRRPEPSVPPGRSCWRSFTSSPDG